MPKLCIAAYIPPLRGLMGPSSRSFSGGEPLGMKSHHVFPHGWFEISRGTVFCLSQCLRVGPTVMRNAVTRNDHSRAILAPVAVDKYGPPRAVIQHGQRLPHIRLARRCVIVEGDLDVPHTGGLYFVPLLGRAARGCPQIEDGLDAGLGKIPKSPCAWLPTAINVRIDASGMGHARDRRHQAGGPRAEQSQPGTERQSHGSERNAGLPHVPGVAIAFPPPRGA